MQQLQGKVAVITGANSGIGLAIAQRFSQEGAQVFMTGRRQTNLDDAVRAVGGNAVGIQGDVSNLDDLDRLYGDVARHAGRIDILCANAGGGEFRRLEEVTEDHFDRTFDSNVKGMVFTVQKALPLLCDGASVILTGSTAGSKGTPAFSVYSASKAAVRNFARSWVLELAPRAIRVNVLSPGSTSTAGWHGLASSEKENLTMQRLTREATPLGRLGEAVEIAAAALFLASSESSYVNGSELFVDGGAAQI